jgi:2-C-methyl-D-erythritol 4-phosphate cytidylyltransferase
LDRDSIKLVQTPQAFHSKILLAAFKIDYKDKFTDEATVVEAFGIKVNLIEGEESNIKITTPEDLYFAQNILNVSQNKILQEISYSSEFFPELNKRPPLP